MARPQMLIVADTHCPWHDARRFREVLKWAKVEKPRAIYHLGDLMDQYLLSRFPKDNTRIFTPDTAKREIKRSVELLASLSAIAPTTWIPGNHDWRVMKEIAKTPFLNLFIDHPLKAIAKRSGATLGAARITVRTQARPDIRFRHEGPRGFINKLKDMSVCQGHNHRRFLWMANNRVWGMEPGHLCDVKAPCFEYSDAATSDWASGFAWLDPKWDPHSESLT